MTYNLIACGGTFDRLHVGHRAFLHFAFSLSKKVVIGITTDAYIAIYKNNMGVAPFMQRKKELVAFLTEEGLLSRAQIVPIDSIEGVTLQKNTGIEALIVTEDSMPGALYINKKRVLHGLPVLPVVMFPLVYVDGGKISSTRIRITQNTLFLPQSLRHVVSQPLGILVPGDLSFIKKIPEERIVTVGDITTQNVISMGKIPKISIVDFMVERKKKFTSLSQLGFSGSEKVITVENPAGSITQDAWKVIEQCILEIKENTYSIISVQGEEDLLVLPLVHFLPIGFVLLYGQPQQDMVQVNITVGIKTKVQDLLKQFTRKMY